jgi:hypothetical protein
MTNEHGYETAAETKFEGECKRGPYDGQLLVHWSGRKLVYVKDGLFIREGVYEFLGGVWIWSGVR